MDEDISKINPCSRNTREGHEFVFLKGYSEDLKSLNRKVSDGRMRRSRSQSQESSMISKIRLSSLKSLVDDCDKVSDLPLVSAIDVSTVEKLPWSCGILCYNIKGDSWLLVKSRNSVCIRTILKGSYVTSSIPVMIERMKPEEREFLTKILTFGNTNEGYKEFEKLCMFTFGKTHGKYTRKSWVRLLSLSDLFTRCISRYGISDGDLWAWPKGRRDLDTESSLECAIRELEEETGMKLKDVKHGICEVPVTISFYSYIRVAFVYEYWLCIVEKEHEVSNLDEAENLSVKWVRTSDLEMYLSDEAKSVFENVIQNISPED